jgi:biotin carboxyl carrier protein
MARPVIRNLCAVAPVAAGTVTILLAGCAPASTETNVVGTVDTNATVLHVRSHADASSPVVDSLHRGSKVSLVCQVGGTSVRGRVRTTDRWDRTTDGRYVSDAYIRRGAIGTCATPSTRPLTAQVEPLASNGWVPPVPGQPGQLFRPPDNPSHNGVDIPEPRNTPIHAANAGTVTTVVCETTAPSCDVDGSESVGGCGWYAEIQHPGQVITRYCHMVRRPSVRVGQQVSTGQVIGYVGTSGNSSGPHLHFEVHVGPGPANRDNAVDPVAFMQRMNAPLGGPNR